VKMLTRTIKSLFILLSVIYGIIQFASKFQSLCLLQFIGIRVYLFIHLYIMGCRYTWTLKANALVLRMYCGRTLDGTTDI